ncbi:MAG: hypothetical protein FWE32_06980 [Oscillospiraceae bacterium]|nr:hypothetical protein [Oscillospiraceae bacterium]
MDYYKSKEFQLHKEKIAYILEKIPSAENPKGWVKKGSFSVGDFEYFGFTELSDILLIISSSGRALIDLAKNEKIARDYSNDFPFDEILLTSKGFDVLNNKTVKLAGKYGGSLLPVGNKTHEMLIRVSPLYPCEDLIFQPPNENCFADGRFKNIRSNNCVRVYRGFLYCYGFSFSGKYFVIADESGVAYWEAVGA